MRENGKTSSPPENYRARTGTNSIAFRIEGASALDAPYDVLPAGVYRETEVRLIPEAKDWTPLRAADRDAYLEEVRRGVSLGEGTYLRRFPVWFDFRGNSSVLLSQAKALSTAAQLRRDLDAEDLAQKQAQWQIGRNPFSSSLMYGEGYDWTPLYSVRSGQMVGALPVGIETKGYNDAPYWPTQICWTYKEVWTAPVGQWIWLMQDISVPATIRGFADPSNHEAIEFREERSGQLIHVAASSDGEFSVRLSEGHYYVHHGTAHTSVTVLPGGIYSLDLRPEYFLDFKVTSRPAPKSDIVVRLEASGAGDHAFSIRSDNLVLPDPTMQNVHLSAGSKKEFVWRAHVVSPETPWVAVVVPDGEMNERVEVTGANIPYK